MPALLVHGVLPLLFLGVGGGAVEERLYRVTAEGGSGERVVALVRAVRRGGRVEVDVVRVEEGSEQAARTLKLMIEALSRGRSSWLYRGPRGAGRHVREVLQAGPRRVAVETQYDRRGWLVRGTAQLAGFRATIEAVEGQH